MRGDLEPQDLGHVSCNEHFKGKIVVVVVAGGSTETTGVSFVKESTVLVAGPARPTEQTHVDDFEPHVEVVEGPKGAQPNVVATIFILIGIVDKPTRVTTVGDNKVPLVLLRSVSAV